MTDRGGTRGPRRPGEGPARDRPRKGPRKRSAQAPSQRARHADPARETALAVLREVAAGAYANLVLPRLLREARITGRDAAFCTELTYGTLRMQGLYDAILAQAVHPPGRQLDPAVRDVLRLGAHQILAMRVPDHAAVSATVALARQQVGSGAGGFVNAVLRTIARQPRAEWVAAVVEPVTDPLDQLAVAHSHPGWIVRALRAALLGHGTSTPESVLQDLTALLEADNEPALPVLVARPGLGAEEELESAGARPDPAAPTAWTLTGGDPGRLAAVREGRAAVQDAGSQLLALALVDAPVEQDGGQWLDLCAGPGGKAGLLAALAVGAGATLRANEVQPHRADLVHQTLAAIRRTSPGTVRITVEDGRQVGKQEPGHYDRVLVDAPCTGLGSLRRRPEARWRRGPGDLAELGPLQRDLLDSALRATRPGGLVLYSTCSPHLAETQFVVSDVLKKHPGVTAEDVRPLLRDRTGTSVPDTGPGPWAQLWPHRHGTDAMFLALLRVT